MLGLALNIPTGHPRHTELSLYWPAGHWSTQKVDEPSLYLFAGQSTQVSVTPSMKNWLVPQQTLVVDEVQRANVPLAQVVVVPHDAHAVLPGLGQVPAGQVVHIDPLELIFPALHVLHRETRMTTRPEPPAANSVCLLLALPANIS